NGVLQVNSPTALGSSVSGTVLTGSGALLLEGVTIANETLYLSSSSSTLQVLNGAAATWTGNVVLNTGLSVLVPAASSLTLSGAISGPGGITKNLPGTLTLSGSSANSFTGTTMVNAGTLVLNKSIFNATIVGPLIIGDGSPGANADV